MGQCLGAVCRLQFIIITRKICGVMTTSVWVRLILAVGDEISVYIECGSGWLRYKYEYLGKAPALYDSMLSWTTNVVLAVHM